MRENQTSDNIIYREMKTKIERLCATVTDKRWHVGVTFEKNHLTFISEHNRRRRRWKITRGKKNTTPSSNFFLLTFFINIRRVKDGANNFSTFIAAACPSRHVV